MSSIYTSSRIEQFNTAQSATTNLLKNTNINYEKKRHVNKRIQPVSTLQKNKIGLILEDNININVLLDPIRIANQGIQDQTFNPRKICVSVVARSQS